MIDLTMLVMTVHCHHRAIAQLKHLTATTIGYAIVVRPHPHVFLIVVGQLSHRLSHVSDIQDRNRSIHAAHNSYL